MLPQVLKAPRWRGIGSRIMQRRLALCCRLR
jgi:hypothetical protein